VTPSQPERYHSGKEEEHSQDRSYQDTSCSKQPPFHIIKAPADPPQPNPHSPKRYSIRIHQECEAALAQADLGEVDLGIVDVRGELGEDGLVIWLGGLQGLRITLAREM
jgi:hypothetical protein